MQVGIALNMLSQPGRVDAAVLSEHMSLGDLAEPLGFDSLFALEHHFTGYAMCPASISHPEWRFYGSANSPESARLIAEAGWVF